MLNLIAVNMDTVLKTLEIFWKGMLAIAIVLLIIIFVTMALNKIDDVIKNKKEKANDESANE